MALIRWTVDPLEGANNALNFGKLGVTCRTYDRHVYGMMGGINAGIESDRFIVDWELASERVRQRRAGERPDLSVETLEAGGALRANLTETVAEGIREITQTQPDLDAPQVLLEIPGDYQAIKVVDLELAIGWRMQTRDLFEAYFGNGYVATEFISEVQQAGERRNYYLLVRS